MPSPRCAEWLRRELPFVGVVYCGLMMTARGPLVLEYNARFGDPETQAILVRLESDLVDALEACIDGRLSETEMRWNSGAAACVVASSSGYPGSYKTGLPVSGLSNAAKTPGVEIFHSGTARVGNQLVTSGGRVLGVTASGDSLNEALARAYEALAQIHFEGMYYRHDIGHRALKQTAPLACASNPAGPTSRWTAVSWTAVIGDAGGAGGATDGALTCF